MGWNQTSPFSFLPFSFISWFLTERLFHTCFLCCSVKKWAPYSAGSSVCCWASFIKETTSLLQKTKSVHSLSQSPHVLCIFVFVASGGNSWGVCLTSCRIIQVVFCGLRKTYNFTCLVVQAPPINQKCVKLGEAMTGWEYTAILLP